MAYDMTLKEILNSEPSFRYRLLDRMRTDCEYYLGYGGRHPKNLWAENEKEQIAYMKALWNSFNSEDKPEWLSYEKILRYEKEMTGNIPAILVEMDYKGHYERFALTPEEFKEDFPETYKDFGPIQESNSDTLKPLVHIWFEPCVVGDGSWELFFTDMEEGLPESDIESGNQAYIRADMAKSLKEYIIPYLENTQEKEEKMAAGEERINIWGRLGISLNITPEQLKVLKGGDREAAHNLFVDLVLSEHCSMHGDTYFPEDGNEHYITEGELEFDLPEKPLHEGYIKQQEKGREGKAQSLDSMITNAENRTAAGSVGKTLFEPER